MRTLKTKRFYQELAKKYNLTLKDIVEIDKAQFELLRKVIESVDPSEEYFPAMRIPYFGMFRIPHTVRKNILKHYRAKLDKDETTGTE